MVDIEIPKEPSGDHIRHVPTSCSPIYENGYNATSVYDVTLWCHIVHGVVLQCIGNQLFVRMVSVHREGQVSHRTRIGMQVEVSPVFTLKRPCRFSI